MDDFKARIESLFAELDRIENQMSSTEDTTQYNQLRREEKQTEALIKQEIDNFWREYQVSQQLEEDLKNEFLATLKKIEEFIRTYGENSQELCNELRQEEYITFVRRYQTVLSQLYQTIWAQCGFGDLTM